MEGKLLSPTSNGLVMGPVSSLVARVRTTAISSGSQKSEEAQSPTGDGAVREILYDTVSSTSCTLSGPAREEKPEPESADQARGCQHE